MGRDAGTTSEDSNGSGATVMVRRIHDIGMTVRRSLRKIYRYGHIFEGRMTFPSMDVPADT
jgi:hypothetical protein